MFISLNKILTFNACISHPLLLFYFTFKIITTISESTNCINVKGVLSHANCIGFNFTGWVMNFFINFLAIIFNLLFKSLFIFLCSFFFNVLLLTQFLFDLKIFTLIQRKNFSFPLPLKVSFAIWILRIVK